jgi:competence protein ComFC
MVAKRGKSRQNIDMESLLDLIMPENCVICGAKGKSLCPNCKQKIIAESSNFCLECGNFIEESCPDCRLPYQKSYTVGFRDEAVGKIAEKYKFSSKRSLARQITDILMNILPDFSPDTVVVPIPTIKKHVRMRGLDHTKKVAKQLAKAKKCRFSPLVSRMNDSVQVGANAKKRLEQAKTAFKIDEKELKKVFNEKSAVFLYDDISTTGSTIKECAKLLKKSGIKNISVIILAKNR